MRRAEEAYELVAPILTKNRCRGRRRRAIAVTYICRRADPLCEDGSQWCEYGIGRSLKRGILCSSGLNL